MMLIVELCALFKERERQSTVGWPSYTGSTGDCWQVSLVLTWRENQLGEYLIYTCLHVLIAVKSHV